MEKVKSAGPAIAVSIFPIVVFLGTRSSPSLSPLGTAMACLGVGLGLGAHRALPQWQSQPFWCTLNRFHRELLICLIYPTGSVVLIAILAVLVRLTLSALGDEKDENSRSFLIRALGLAVSSQDTVTPTGNSSVRLSWFGGTQALLGTALVACLVTWFFPHWAGLLTWVPFATFAVSLGSVITSERSLAFLQRNVL